MDVVNFWKLVKKYPWLPGVLMNSMHVGNDLRKFPGDLDQHFGIDAIEKGIRYILFKPWESLPGNTLPGTRQVTVQLPEITCHVEGNASYDIWYHQKRGWTDRKQRFTEITWNGLSSMHSSDCQNPSTAINLIKTATRDVEHHLDLFVITTHVEEQWYTPTPSSSKTKILVPNSYSYDIYSPRPIA